MATSGTHGGARPGAGRKPKIVEDAQQSVLARVFNEKEEELSVKAMIRQAKKGDVAAFNTLMDRKYGKVPQQQIMTGANDGPIIVAATTGQEALELINTWRQQTEEPMRDLPNTLPVVLE